jgi:hypothetical protein
VAPLAGVPALQFNEESASSGVSDPVQEKPYELPWQPCTEESAAHVLCPRVTQQKSVFDSSAVPGPQSRFAFLSVGWLSPEQEYPFAAFAQLMLGSELHPSGLLGLLLTVHAAKAAPRQNAVAILFIPGSRPGPGVHFIVVLLAKMMGAPCVPRGGTRGASCSRRRARLLGRPRFLYEELSR